MAGRRHERKDEGIRWLVPAAVLTLSIFLAIPWSAIPERSSDGTNLEGRQVDEAIRLTNPGWEYGAGPAVLSPSPGSYRAPGSELHDDALVPEEGGVDALVTPVPTPAEVPVLPRAGEVRDDQSINSEPAADDEPSVTLLGAPVSVRATWYGLEDGYGVEPGKLITASGERFDPLGLSAATRLYPLITVLEVCYQGRCVRVRVTDSCGACSLDLSRGAFAMLAPLSRGVITVEVRVTD